jgi:hypothetical protein
MTVFALLVLVWLADLLRRALPEPAGGYCVAGPGCDVSAHFHLMGHHVCATCAWTCRSKGGLVAHLEDHRSRGDRVPESAFARLRLEQEANWT